MANIKEVAKAYIPPITKNISELDSIDLDSIDIFETEYTDKDGKIFTVQECEIDGDKYRVPISVIKEIKLMLEVKPELKTVRVVKSGTGFNTEYKVLEC